MADIFALYLQDGGTLYAIVRALRERQIPSPTSKACWGLTTLRGLLTNPVYMGRIYAGRNQYRAAQVRRSATHALGRCYASTISQPPSEWQLVAEVPAIVTPAQFDLVQTKLEHNKAAAPRNNKAHPYLLRALVSCGRCQYACLARTQTTYHYYVCSNKGNEHRRHGAEPCPAGLIPSEQLDEVVWQDVYRILSEPTQITAALDRAQGGEWMPQEWQARQANVQKAQMSLRQQIDRLTEAYLQGIIPLAEYQRRRSETEQKAQNLLRQEEQLQQAQQQHELAGVAARITEFCQRVHAGLDQASFEQKRRLVELLIDRVIVTEDQIEIRYVIPTGPAGEHTRFCQLRTDYFHLIEPRRMFLHLHQPSPMRLIAQEHRLRFHRTQDPNLLLTPNRRRSRSAPRSAAPSSPIVHVQLVCDKDPVRDQIAVHCPVNVRHKVSLGAHRMVGVFILMSGSRMILGLASTIQSCFTKGPAG